MQVSPRASSKLPLRLIVTHTHIHTHTHTQWHSQLTAWQMWQRALNLAALLRGGRVGGAERDAPL